MKVAKGMGKGNYKKYGVETLHLGMGYRPAHAHLASSKDHGVPCTQGQRLLLSLGRANTQH
eukprot:2558666-Karenia_brevis.AAC.1